MAFFICRLAGGRWNGAVIDSTRHVSSCYWLRMSGDAPQRSLIEELDIRQNELLDQLDGLNQRIEQVLCECGVWRQELGICGAPASQ
jgi:hypothetical protein